jgi:hypothetical protein
MITIMELVMVLALAVIIMTTISHKFFQFDRASRYTLRRAATNRPFCPQFAMPAEPRDSIR